MSSLHDDYRAQLVNLLFESLATDGFGFGSIGGHNIYKVRSWVFTQTSHSHTFPPEGHYDTGVVTAPGKS